MAIDFMVMPMSRYISGDFVTPVMRFAWAQDVPYAIVEPGGKRELPPGVPFGGPDSALRRAQFVEMVLEDLRTLPPEVSNNLWDERSDAEPCFHRVDPASYEALLTYFARVSASHCTATLFLPCDFEEPVALVSPFERTAGAAGRALQELASSTCPPEAASAIEMLREALTDSLRLRLPLIVDW